jgi:NAD(P)-dependent dehydrogenase (short-subunit alcohol dehydrogenase family)
MTNTQSERFLGTLHDCYYSTDPRVNKELAEKLTGKNVLIAGAGRGIGRACAEFFSYCSPKSISLVALERDQVEETAKICKGIHQQLETKTGVFDVTDPKAVREFVAEVDKNFGSVDVLLMNAGRPPQWLPVAEGDPDIWWETVEVGLCPCLRVGVIGKDVLTDRLPYCQVSLRGAYNFTRYVVPIMQKHKSGRIIFTASAGAHSNKGISAYIMGKVSTNTLNDCRCTDGPCLGITARYGPTS